MAFVYLLLSHYMCHSVTLLMKKHRLALKNTGSGIAATYLIFYCTQSKAALFSWWNWN